MTRILLVRHGQSEWNALGRWQGQENPPLTDLGRAQARAAADRLGSVDGIVASPLQRAADTALIVSNQLGVGPVGIVDGLMERTAGSWEGLTREEIGEQYPGYLDDGRRPPGWEDDSDLERRTLGALDEIVERFPGGDIVAVTHAGVLYSVLGSLGQQRHGGRIPNLGGFWIEPGPRGWVGGDLVELLDGDLRTVPGQI